MALSDFWNRLRNLIRRPSTPARQVPRAPTAPVPRPTPRQVVQPKPIPKPEVKPPKLPEAPVGPLTTQEIMFTISKAGRQRKMLNMTYDGTTRLVEPYSYRDRSGTRLFFGWCSIHDRVHSFSLPKISHIEITDYTYSPRWPVEV